MTAACAESTRGSSFVEFHVIANFHYGISYRVNSRLFLRRVPGDPQLSRRQLVQSQLEAFLMEWRLRASFVEFQVIPTTGVVDWEAFDIEGTPYLAVASFLECGSHNVNSKPFRWSGASFVEFQMIPTTGAVDWVAFDIECRFPVCNPLYLKCRTPAGLSTCLLLRPGAGSSGLPVQSPSKLLVHGILQFTMLITLRCALHRCSSRDIRR